MSVGPVQCELHRVPVFDHLSPGLLSVLYKSNNDHGKREVHKQAETCTGTAYGYGNGVRQFDSVHMVYDFKHGAYAVIVLFLLCQHGTFVEVHMMEQDDLLVKKSLI